MKKPSLYFHEKITYILLRYETKLIQQLFVQILKTFFAWFDPIIFPVSKWINDDLIEYIDIRFYVQLPNSCIFASKEAYLHCTSWVSYLAMNLRILLHDY